MLGLALSLRGSPTTGEDPPYLATVRNKHGWSVAALLTPPHPLVLSATEEAPAPALALLAEHLRSLDRPLSGVVAPPALSTAFATQWSRVSGQAAEIAMRQRLYRLYRVTELPHPPGRLRPATREDLEVVSRWMVAFEAEAMHEIAPERARQVAARKIEREEIYLWEDTQPRTMAARARPTRHTVAINSVYTPPKWRRQGLATAAVAQLSRKLLREGCSMCVLFTDLANPTSNSIYTRIGYEPVCDFTLCRFAPSNPAA